MKAKIVTTGVAMKSVKVLKILSAIAKNISFHSNLFFILGKGRRKWLVIASTRSNLSRIQSNLRWASVSTRPVSCLDFSFRKMLKQASNPSRKCPRHFLPRQAKNRFRGFSLVGALGFEPRVTSSQVKHVSRYTTPRCPCILAYKTEKTTSRFLFPFLIGRIKE